MTIISQLIQFIFYRREVKDIEYNPRFAVIAILADALPLMLLTLVINDHGLKIGEATINNASIGLGLTYATVFSVLFYTFYAAQEKQARFIQAATAFFGTSIILTLANGLITPLPGSGVLGLIILGLKVSCAIRVMTESLDYGVARAVFSLIGISIMAMSVALILFPVDITQATLISE